MREISESRSDRSLFWEDTRPRESERGDFQGRPSAKRAMDSFQGSPEPTPVVPPAMVPTPAKPKDTAEPPITMQTPDNVIGETLVVQGRIEFQNLLRIDGHFEGELVGNGSLIIGPTAEVISNLRGLHEVYVEGILIGDCQCNKMQIRFSGCVTGNLQCGSLGMDPSVVLKGSANVNPREKPDKSKPRTSTSRPRQQRSQARGIPDEVSASSKTSGSTSVISPESLPAEAGVFDDSKAPSKQKSKGRDSMDNEGGRGHGRGSMSSSSESTTSPSSTLDGEMPPPMPPPPKESGSSAAVVVPKVGDTVNMGRGRPPVFGANKQSGSGTSQS